MVIPVHEQTAGEKAVQQLLEKLPSNRFFFHTEPQIITRNGQGRRPDFVLIDGQRGVLTIEVKDWVRIVKGGSKQVTIKRRDGQEMTLQDPMETCRGYNFALIDSLKARLHQDRLPFPCEPLVILPNISTRVIRQFEEANVWVRGQVIGREDLLDVDTFRHALGRIPWHFRAQSRIDNDLLNVVRGVIDPQIIVRDNAGNDVGTLTRLQEELTREALDTAETTSVRLVRGVAGSGKSLVLMYRALYLKQQYPDRQILVLAFNKDLTEYLDRRIDDDRIEVTNFHKLIPQIMKRANRRWVSPLSTTHIRGWMENHVMEQLQRADLDMQFVIDEIAWRKDTGCFDNDEYLEIARKGRSTPLPRDKRVVVNRVFEQYRAYQQKERDDNGGMHGADWADTPYLAVEVLAQANHPMRHAYDVIMLDEAQDFAPSWMQVIKLLLKPDGSLFICDDPTQSLFRYFSWKQKGIDVRGRTKLLRTPFRCTQEITRAAHALVAADPVLSHAGNLPEPDFERYTLKSGPVPRLTGFRDADAEFRYVEEQIAELMAQGIDVGEIAVLCHGKRATKQFARLRNQGIYVENFYKMKGLEFQAVFVPHLHDVFERKSPPVDEGFIAETRQRLYTAMTRARHTLVMTYQERVPKELLQPIEQAIWHEKP